MCRKDGVFWITGCLTLILIMGSVASVAKFDEDHLRSTATVPEPKRGQALGAGTPHSPIVIDGDVNFNATAQAEGWPGNGTSGDPYIIEGLDIDLGGAPGHGISISNTRVNFTIRNCNLTFAGVSPGSGIYLYNVTYGMLINNTCASSTYGIYLDSSDFNDVVNNTCTSSNAGIHIWSSDSNTVANNTCDSNTIGIYVRSTATSNILVNNTCISNSYGIYLDSFISNTLFNNTCSYNSNSGIYLAASDINTVANNTCDTNTIGIYIRDTSTLNTVVNNTFTGSTYGIYLDVSDSNTVANNTCTSNSYGIHIFDSDLNDIQWNIFINSPTNADDGGAGNIFEYNYWSDYSGHDADGNGIGDTPYSFTGNQDPHPLMAPPGSLLFWLESPIDHVIELGNPLRYDLNASVYGGLDYWWINDTLNFAIDQSGVITNNTFLLAEDYGVRVHVNDTSGYVLSGTFTVTVSDLSPPVWIESPTTQVLEFGSGFYYNLNASDYSGLDTWWINDTDHFVVDSSGVVTNKTVLVAGVYPCEVWVNDTSGNSLSGIFTLTVHAASPPVWIANPMDQVVELGEALIYDLDVTDMSGIGTWWLNDTTYFTIDQDGTITNSTPLAVGIYGILISVSDTLGNIQSSEITITVVDTTSPTTTPTTTDTTPEGLHPMVILALGLGIGGAAVVAIVIVFLRKRT